MLSTAYILGQKCSAPASTDNVSLTQGVGSDAFCCHSCSMFVARTMIDMSEEDDDDDGDDDGDGIENM